MPALHFGSRRRTKASTLLWYAAALVAAVTIDASYGYASEDAKMVANLSPWAMFMAADMVVKGVMTSLAVASVLVWGAWMGKLIQVSLTKMRVTRDVRRLMEADSLEIASDAFGGRRDAIAIMVQSAVGELVRSDRARLPASGIKERVTSHLARIEAAGGRAMARGTSLIATVGATAPFVGLFGTVWGIMNSFIGISKAQTTNLAVVAPGIAEALLATAIGLVAAIPAVIFYNQLARTISGYKALLADASAAIERLVSRDLDRLKGGEAVRVAAAAE